MNADRSTAQMRAWDIVIMAIQEAHNRYGMRLYGTVELETGFYSLRFLCREVKSQEVEYETARFSMSVETLEDAKGAAHYSAVYVIPMLREFARLRDDKGTNDVPVRPATEEEILETLEEPEIKEGL